ncbi:MAG TPA: hypothetical protein VGN17_30680 [Bryobacteraceae bacterium]
MGQSIDAGAGKDFPKPRDRALVLNRGRPFACLHRDADFHKPEPAMMAKDDDHAIAFPEFSDCPPRQGSTLMRKGASKRGSGDQLRIAQWHTRCV